MSATKTSRKFDDEEPARRSSPSLSSILLVVAGILFVIVMSVAVAALFVSQKNSTQEINLLKENLRQLNIKISLSENVLLESKTGSFRRKRQTSNPRKPLISFPRAVRPSREIIPGDGNKPAVFDYAYGIGTSHGGLNNLRHYPFGGPTSTSSNTGVGFSQHHHRSNNIGQQNQISQSNQIRQQSKSGSGQPQSAYAKRVNPHRGHRNSRVSQTSSAIGSSNIQKLPVQSTTQTPPILKRPQLRSLDSDGSLDALRNITAIHLQAKVSNADESAANLASGLYTSWRHSHWCKGNDFYKLDKTTGQIIMSETGLYLIYAQVEYLDEHAVNGYEVYLNNEPVLSCVTSTGGGGHSPDNEGPNTPLGTIDAGVDPNLTPVSGVGHNTCFTSAVIYVKQGGKIHVRDKEAGRYSLLHSTGTFFGAAKFS